MASTISELQAWYAAQCDGDWEHRYGVSIGTLDNPGWCLCIDLAGTNLAEASFAEVKENFDDASDWLICTKQNGQWSGNGGPRQLERLMEIFLAWAQANPLPQAGSSKT